MIGNKDIGKAVQDIIRATNDLPNLRDMILREEVFANILYLNNVGTLVADFDVYGVKPFTIEGANHIVKIYNEFLYMYEDYHITRQLTPSKQYRPYNEVFN